ncbi:MAG TPA: hypothetical protein VGJ79_08835 [Candidatus Dormibacteraeota bacterium]|jgi:hypothetical protein
MTQSQTPFSADDRDGWPPVKPGLTLRRKLVLLAVPTILAVAAVPVGIAHAHGTVQGHAAAAATVHVTRTVAVKHVHAAAPKVAAKAAATEPVEATDPTTDPAETGTDTGHSDEVAGSTTESTVDHQFDGQE